MRALIYCVFAARSGPRPRRSGVDGTPVDYVAEGELCAAMSLVDEAALAPSLERVKAYEAVVEALFRDRAVVPMRYGSSVHSPAQLAQLLREQAARFGRLLEEVEGCVELGVRVPAQEGRDARAAPRRAAPAAPARPGPGHAYLASRRVSVGADLPQADVAGLVERCRSAFAGLYVRLRAEPSQPLRLALSLADGRLRLSQAGAGPQEGRAPEQRGSLALSFLVPRASVKAFREAFERLVEASRLELRLSGPWPPYSFV